MKKIFKKNQMVKIVTLDAEGDWEDVLVSKPIPFQQARRLLTEEKRRYAKLHKKTSLFWYGDTYEYCFASCQNDRHEMVIVSARKR